MKVYTTTSHFYSYTAELRILEVHRQHMSMDSSRHKLLKV